MKRPAGLTSPCKRLIGVDSCKRLHNYLYQKNENYEIRQRHYLSPKVHLNLVYLKETGTLKAKQ